MIERKEKGNREGVKVDMRTEKKEKKERNGAYVLQSKFIIRRKDRINTVKIYTA